MNLKKVVIESNYSLDSVLESDLENQKVIYGDGIYPIDKEAVYSPQVYMENLI